MTRLSFNLLVGIALLTAIAAQTPTSAQEITLRLHHFLSEKSATHLQLLRPWAERLQADSGGRLEVQVVGGMGLGGRPAELYRQAKDGRVDIVMTVAGYTPGQFPRVEVFELPSVHRGSARATNLAIHDTFELIAEDFPDVQPLLAYVHPGNALHLRDHPVNSPDDIIGLKIRTSSRTNAWMLNDIGAQALGLPIRSLPGAIDTGLVEGAMIPFSILRPLKLTEKTRYSVEGENGERFGTSVFLLVMNKARYESLPDDLKAILQANTGAPLAHLMGELLDRAESDAKQVRVETGGEIIRLTAGQWRVFDATSAKITERWISEAQAFGIDARALVEAASAAVDRHSQ
ncbi:MAG: TRAP transporter substrate-binding protein [Rhodobacteraceae bacterium]|nr:TRAP transporter substrate-binding protein [Paracoccaceae bacterium]